MGAVTARSCIEADRGTCGRCNACHRTSGRAYRGPYGSRGLRAGPSSPPRRARHQAPLDGVRLGRTSKRSLVDITFSHLDGSPISLPIHWFHFQANTWRPRALLDKPHHRRCAGQRLRTLPGSAGVDVRPARRGTSSLFLQWIMDVPDGSPFYQIVDRPNWQLASMERNAYEGDEEMVIYIHFLDCQERWLGSYDCDDLVDVVQLLESTRKLADTDFEDFLLKLRHARDRTREIRDMAPPPRRFIRWLLSLLR